MVEMFLNDWNAISQLYQCLLTFSRALPGECMFFFRKVNPRFVLSHVHLFKVAAHYDFFSPSRDAISFEYLLRGAAV